MRVDVQLIGVCLGWLAGWWLLWRVPQLVRTPPRRAPSISVVVPARNEARALPALLAALQRQDLPPWEVIVVDDESTDATAEVARAARVTVHPAGPLPAGWTGKAWACFEGARLASGDLLVFLDADTQPAPDLLRRLAAQHERAGGLISVQPYHRTGRRVERLAALFNVVAFMGVGAGVPWRRRRIVGAFGPCLATQRERYLELGGHGAVRSAVLEDVALAAHYQDAGEPVHVYGGGDAVAFRMYPDGVGQLVEGFGKNFASGANSLPATRLLLVFAWITALLSAAYELGRELVDVATGAGGLAAITVVAYCAFVAQLGVFFRRLGDFGVTTAALYPVAAAAFLAVFLWSLVLQVRGEVRWKGRTIAVRTRSGRT